MKLLLPCLLLLAASVRMESTDYVSAVIPKSTSISGHPAFFVHLISPTPGSVVSNTITLSAEIIPFRPPGDPRKSQ